ncbi:TauD/TfdA family dioxygenase [Streptomyces caniscabiei]|uniref:TauD/TfdA family dioxygenase n=1 Tax=Streptomyces caniscabiei TaxID=2746961 RepID=UPI0029ADC218|nr:TauD/TfdA family dioxygenase [Streptomyces caniscabiei]MDX2599656.1 TauD/TfdA family dioxygenase [Streptomyces caniscabiei]MDX2735049.1 TauD/TfdA family dioxygenase [Streptomyces caniscabiei]MDX2776745.1 TauD/TfdA family dioxygenase [Streptomyces caniscabiei]
MTDASAVRFGPVEPSALPVLATPHQPGVPLTAWVRANTEPVREQLHRNGAVLFRGFDEGADALRPVVEALGGDEALSYQDGATPRSELDDGVYSSTEYPADQTIEMHNEACYSWSWPRVLGFACALPPQSGGQTPLTDSRKVLRRIPADLLARLQQHGVRYVRNYTPGVGIPWQEALGCDESGMRSYAERTRVQLERVADDHLRTEALRPAVVRHPDTGEWVWFNQATSFHLSTIGDELAEELLGQVGTDRVPKTSTIGDGSEFTKAELDAIRAAFAAETTSFDWQLGDVLVVDNLLAAHGRAPFTGKREIRVAMAAGADWQQVESLPAAAALAQDGTTTHIQGGRQ